MFNAHMWKISDILDDDNDDDYEIRAVYFITHVENPPPLYEAIYYETLFYVNK
jgi:hypothetical protein